MTIIAFTVHGVPATAGSKVAFTLPNKKTGGVIMKGGRPLIVTKDSSGAKGETWRSDVREALRAVYSGEPLEGPLKLTIEFVRVRPKGHFKQSKGIVTDVLNPKGLASRYPTGKPDCTKLTRAIEDAIKSLAYIDDSQIVSQIISKRWGTFPLAFVSLESLEESDDVPDSGYEVHGVSTRRWRRVREYSVDSGQAGPGKRRRRPGEDAGRRQERSPDR